MRGTVLVCRLRRTRTGQDTKIADERRFLLEQLLAYRISDLFDRFDVVAWDKFIIGIEELWRG